MELKEEIKKVKAEMEVETREAKKRCESLEAEIDEIGERYESFEAEIRNGWKKECDRLSKANAALWFVWYNSYNLNNYLNQKDAERNESAGQLSRTLDRIKDNINNERREIKNQYETYRNGYTGY